MGTYVDHSGTIAAANTVYQLMPINSGRTGLSVLNLDTAAPGSGHLLYINFDNPSATTDPGWIPLDSSFGNIFMETGAPTNKVSIYSPTAGLPYTAYEQ